MTPISKPRICDCLQRRKPCTQYTADLETIMPPFLYHGQMDNHIIMPTEWTHYLATESWFCIWACLSQQAWYRGRVRPRWNAYVGYWTSQRTRKRNVSRLTLVTPPKRSCFRRCLSVCLLATLCKNFRTDLHEIFREGWQWANEQTIKF